VLVAVEQLMGGRGDLTSLTS